MSSSFLTAAMTSSTVTHRNFVMAAPLGQDAKHGNRPPAVASRTAPTLSMKYCRNEWTSLALLTGVRRGLVRAAARGQLLVNAAIQYNTIKNTVKRQQDTVKTENLTDCLSFSFMFMFMFTSNFRCCIFLIWKPEVT